MEMQYKREREEILWASRRLTNGGIDFLPATDGNISVRVDKSKILITPTTRFKENLTAEEILLTDIDGNLLEGNGFPSSEMMMHLSIYRERADVFSVVHAHPVFTLSLSVSGRSIPTELLSESLVRLGKDVPVAPFAVPGTEEVSESVRPYIKGSNAIILSNHGAVTFGKDIYDAVARMETLEHLSKIAYLCYLLGEPEYIPEDGVKRILSFFKGKR